MLLARCLETLDFNRDFTRGEMTVTTRMLKEAGTGTGASEGIINMITDVDTILVAVLYRQVGRDNWKVSLRSKQDLDVAALAKRHGGGGHKRAAGFTMQGPLSDVMETVQDEVDGLISGRDR